MAPIPKFEYKRNYNYLEWFDTQSKVRTRLDLPGNAFGYKKALEAFRVSGKVPCKYIPDNGKIIMQMVDQLPMKNLLEVLKQTSWYYIEVKYGRTTVEIALTGNPESIRRRRVLPTWWNEEGTLCGTDYDNASKISMSQFYAMLIADVMATLTGVKTNAAQTFSTATDMKEMWEDLEWQEVKGN